MITENISIFCDGGSRGNPGPAAYGFVVFSNTKKIYEEGKTLGVQTNNFAEYSAVINALRYIVSSKHRLSSIKFFLDSKLVVEQLSGKWKIKNENLRSLCHTIKTLEYSLGMPITYKHIPREKNTEADLLVNKALDNFT
jgi:ribonuclease HI